MRAMIYLIFGIFIIVYGIWYAVNPMRFLRKKYMGDEVPELSVKIARVSGIVFVVIGIVGVIYGAVKLMAGG